MDSSVLLLILNIIQVFCLSSNKEQRNLIIDKCPNLTKSKMLDDCSNSTFVEITNIGNKTEKDVLCTIYLHHMHILVETLITVSPLICNDSKLFLGEENTNSKICEHPEFLMLHQSDVKNLSFLCLKLCFDWNGQVEQKCSLAYYYYNILNNNTKGGQNDIQANSNNVQMFNTILKDKESLNFEKNVTLSYIESNIPTKSLNNHQVTSNNSNPNNISLNKKLKENNGDELATVSSLSNSNLTNNSSNKGPDEVIHSNKKLLDQLMPQDQGLVNQNEEDFSNGQNELKEEDDSTFNDNQEQESIRKDAVKMEKPNTLAEDTPVNNMTTDVDGESYFFSYFMVICILFIMGYVFYHNRAKVMALVLEGKRNKRQSRSRRPNSANYHKLDSTLEEALSSTCNKNSTQIIY